MLKSSCSGPTESVQVVKFNSRDIYPSRIFDELLEEKEAIQRRLQEINRVLASIESLNEGETLVELPTAARFAPRPGPLPP